MNSIRRFLILMFCLSFGAVALSKTTPQKTDKVTFTNKLIDGKKVWQPAEAKVKVGHKVELTLVNTLGEPHGFSVPGLAEDVVVNANETKNISFEAKAAGSYPFKCQLHPAHVGGAITVTK